MNAMMEADGLWQTEALYGGKSIPVARAKPKVAVVGGCESPPAASGSIEREGDCLLTEWGRWNRDNGELGFPKRSVTEKAREGGIDAGSPRPPTEMPEDVALTDTVIAKIRLRDKSVLWRAIEIVYLRGASTDALQRALNVSRSQAYRLLGRCRRAVYLGRQEIA